MPASERALDAPPVLRRLAGRWTRVTGSYHGRAFSAKLATRRLVDPDVVTMLQYGGVHSDCSLEDAVLAVAAMRGDDSFRCRFTTSGGHVHDYAGPTGTSPVLVLLHPLAGNCNNWVAVATALRGQCRVIALDLPGHGWTRSKLPRSVTLGEAYARWIDAALDELEVPDQLHLVGHSLGGRVAAHYAAAGARRVLSLTMIAPALRPSMSGLRGLAAIAAERFALIRQRRGIRYVASAIFFDMLVARTTDNKRLLAHALSDALRDQARQRYAGVRQALGWLRREPTDELLDWPSVVERTRTVALFGESDQYCPVERHAHLAEQGIAVSVVPRTGHLLPLEEPDLVNDVLTAQITSG